MRRGSPPDHFHAPLLSHRHGIAECLTPGAAVLILRWKARYEVRAVTVLYCSACLASLAGVVFDVACDSESIGPNRPRR
jgi:hypothetical protein